MKKEDVIIKANDDEVRTCASQNYATTTLCTEEFFLRTSYILVYIFPHISREVCGGQDIDSQSDTYRPPWLGFSSQLNLYTAEQDLRNLYNYFVIEEDV